MFFFLIIFQEDSKIYNHARNLERFFNQQIEKWLPKYHIPTQNDITNETDIIQPAKRIRQEFDEENNMITE